ncbi:hypothetical protein ACFOD0_03095 [Shewanella intestini]|uniref:Uncharacterized protein n=1 Tax=Shewanella intestini TaxID=2017544 RepID=A0ABS5I275_9GAMM|nr:MULTISPECIES: hypothetical protein [Shewanella]MBR9727986.1 hypothetical protein [Shewanella intestini]MRG36463.1 hypothetical protein [Shewanella sp. XMDDZSB0408]
MSLRTQTRQRNTTDNTARNVANTKHNDYSNHGDTAPKNAAVQHQRTEEENQTQLEASHTSFSDQPEHHPHLAAPEQPLVDIESLTPEKIAELEVINQRRDHITLLAIKGMKFDDVDLLNSLAQKYHCSANDIMGDMQLLTNPEVWNQHKLRLKNAQDSQVFRKQQLKENRKNQVSEFMNESVKFTSELLVALSQQFECQPRHIVEDIMHYKTFKNLHETFKQSNVTLPTVRAIYRCAKLNIQY